MSNTTQVLLTTAPKTMSLSPTKRSPSGIYVWIYGDGERGRARTLNDAVAIGVFYNRGRKKKLIPVEDVDDETFT